MFNSQDKQDEYLETYIFKGYKNGIFMDIGAHDGISINNTFQNTSTATRTIKEVITIESDSSDSTEDVSYENQNQNQFQNNRTDDFNVFRMNSFSFYFLNLKIFLIR